MANTSKCPWCPAELPMDTAADKEAAREHIADCARSGNGREVVQAATTQPPTPWKVKS